MIKKQKSTVSKPQMININRHEQNAAEEMQKTSETENNTNEAKSSNSLIIGVVMVFVIAFLLKKVILG